MNKKALPCNSEKLKAIVAEYGTPFHLYSETEILARVRRLQSAFGNFPSFKEFFAVKATPTPALMKLLHREGCGMDASSLSELLLCEKIGITGEDIMFSSNGTKPEEFRYADKLGVIINLDDIFFIKSLKESVETFPELISFRINPGGKKTGNAIIGDPVEAKFGITLDQVIPAYRQAREAGATRFGIHAMTGSNMLDEAYFPETVRLLAEIVLELKKELGIEIEFMNIGGGFGIPYRPEEDELDIEMVAGGIEKVFAEIFEDSAPKLFMENGRWITGPAGWLVAEAISRKEIYKNYVALDACMADLMRPGMYNAYHHISVPGKEDLQEELVDVTGSLCENNDKFCIDRKLPKIEAGDLVVIHDAGAHGRAMGFNYNGKLRTQEILLKSDGSTELIRRKETFEDYISTLIF